MAAMKKPAAAPKAKAAAAPKARAAASSKRAPPSTAQSPVAKRVQLMGMGQDALVHTASMQKELQDALTRAAAAEAREEAAREQMKNAQAALTQASTLAQERTERAASAEGELKMLREVYDQMHDAYAGSMNIIQNVAKALPQPLPLSDSDNLRMLEPPNAPSPDFKSPKVRSLSPASNQPVPSPSLIPLQLPPSAVPRSPDASGNSSPGAKPATTARLGRANSFDNTPGARTPMKDARRTPDKTDKQPDRIPSTPANIDHAVVSKPAGQEESAPIAERSDPRKVLESLAPGEWPKTVNQWGLMQNRIWAGHEPLPQGWVRIWSKQHDNEYYLHCKTKKTTFDIHDVKAWGN